MDWVQLSQATMRKVYFLPLSPQEFLVLISSILKRCKHKLTLKTSNGFEHGNPGLGIQYPNHYANAPSNFRHVELFQSYLKKIICSLRDDYETLKKVKLELLAINLHDLV